MSLEPISTTAAPPPAGTYSQAVAAAGLVFLAGQTPRLPSGERINSAPFAEQARQTLRNLEAVAHAAGLTLAQTAMMTVFLRDPSNAAAFDAVWCEVAPDVRPARAIVQSDLPGFAIEVTAILAPT